MTEKVFASLDDLDFDGAPPVRPVSDPLLQWFNGLPTDDDRIAKGWHIERGKQTRIDEVCQELGLVSYNVYHRGSGKTVPYWRLGVCSLFVITAGLQSVQEMNASRERIGIAYGWQNHKGNSKLKFRAIIQELAARGYIEPFTVSLEGTITREMVVSLGEQFRALDAYKIHREKRGKAGSPPYYALSLPLHPASQIKVVGHGEHGEQYTILPMFAAIPQPVTADYLREHLCTVDLYERIRDLLLAPTVLWSNDTTRNIYQGSDRESWEDEQAEIDRELEPSPPQHPTSPRSAPAQVRENGGKLLPVSEQQLATIRKLCEHLARPLPDNCAALSFQEARDLIATLSHQYRTARAKLPVAPQDTGPVAQVDLAVRCKALGRDYGIVVKSILKAAPDAPLTREQRIVLARTLDTWEQIEREKAAKATSGK